MPALQAGGGGWEWAHDTIEWSGRNSRKARRTHQRRGVVVRAHAQLLLLLRAH